MSNGTAPAPISQAAILSRPLPDGSPGTEGPWADIDRAYAAELQHHTQISRLNQANNSAAALTFITQMIGIMLIGETSDVLVEDSNPATYDIQEAPAEPAEPEDAPPEPSEPPATPAPTAAVPAPSPSPPSVVVTPPPRGDTPPAPPVPAPPVVQEDSP